ncbi:unnamed protein product, partial [marine sediment metagenome]
GHRRAQEQTGTDSEESAAAASAMRNPHSPHQ